jgi:hypothetical protein
MDYTPQVEDRASAGWLELSLKRLSALGNRSCGHLGATPEFQFHQRRSGGSRFLAPGARVEIPVSAEFPRDGLKFTSRGISAGFPRVFRGISVPWS